MVNPLLAPGDRPGGILPRYRALGTLKAGTLRKVIAGALADCGTGRTPSPKRSCAGTASRRRRKPCAPSTSRNASSPSGSKR